MKLGTKLKIKTYFGAIREGILKEVLPDGSMFVEVDEQVMPDLAADVVIHDRKGRPFVIYRSRFPNWQAWIKPEGVLAVLDKDNSVKECKATGA